MKTAKLKSVTHAIKSFWRQRDATAAGIGMVTASVIISFVAAGTQAASYSVSMKNTEQYGMSMGKYAASANSCSFLNDSNALATCITNLTSSVTAYLTYAGVPQGMLNSATILPGVWCPAQSKFISTADVIAKVDSCSTAANNSPQASIQVSLTSNWSPAALKTTLSKLNQRFTWTLVGTRVDEVASTAVCPGIALDRNIFIHDDDSGNLYDQKNGTLTADGKKLLKVVYGKSDTYGDQTLSHPMVAINPSGEAKPSLPSSESTGSNWKPFTTLSTSTDSNGKKRTKLTTSSYYGISDSSFSASQTKIGNNFTDPKYGSRTNNDSGSSMAFRGMKDLEGKTCIALLYDGNGNTDKKIINEGIEIKVQKFCSGSRDRKTDGKGGWLKDGSGKYQMFAMDEAHKNYDTSCGDGTVSSPEISMSFYAFNRSSESDDIVKSDYSKFEGKNTGSTKEAKGVKGTHGVAERKSVYVN